jgi:hypothetical protein
MSSINVILDDKEKEEEEALEPLSMSPSQMNTGDLIKRIEKLENFIKKADIRIAKRQEEWARQTSISTQEQAKVTEGMGLYGFGKGKEA